MALKPASKTKFRCGCLGFCIEYAIWIVGFF